MQFSKMHGLGNDFMVVDAVTQNVFLAGLIRRTADRHLGVGFDQLLVVEPPYDPDLVSTTGSLTPTAAKCRSAATAHAVLPASSG